MKKIFTIVACLIMATKCFAYSDSSIVDFDQIIYALMIWWVLNIILFFKIWGMTNDVKAIKDKLCDDTNDENEETKWDYKITNNNEE